MPELPDEIKQQFSPIEFPPDLGRRVVIAWSNLKELKAMQALEILVDEPRRMLTERLNRLEAWCKNHFS